jgi:hypothetical protein
MGFEFRAAQPVAGPYTNYTIPAPFQTMDDVQK